MDGGAWLAAVLGVAKSRIRLSDKTTTELTYSAVLFTAVQQSNSVIHTYMHIFLFYKLFLLWFFTGY